MLNSPSLRGSSIFRILIFLPYVVPFVAGVLIWQNMLLPDTGWLNEGAARDRHRQPARLAQRSNLDLSGPGPRRTLGDRRRRDHQPGRAERTCRPSCTTPPRSTAPAGGRQLRHVTLPLMSPVIFYSLTLGVVEVMQYFLVPFVLKNGTGEPGGTTLLLQPVHLQELLHVPAHVLRRRRWRGCCS